MCLKDGSVHTERAVAFDCEGEQLIGVVALPDVSQARLATTAVLIIVGGPQYRVGSHRQFVLLARFLADNGVPCMRFDYRGMGDATGTADHGFEDVTPDIDAAIEALLHEAPCVERVVLWGLCDGASAICFSLGHNARVSGAVLLNPWVRTASSEARTMLKHYYLRRLFDKQFWAKLLRGGVSVRSAVGGVSLAVGQVTRRADQPAKREVQGSVPDRMLKGLNKGLNLPIAIFLSGRDYVAREFEHCVTGDKAWAELVSSARCDLLHFKDADHTFSNSEVRDAVAAATLDWVRSLPQR